MAEKLIEFRNGLLSFVLPAHWVEEYDEEGATFYEERDDSGTLRLDVATYALPEDAGAAPERELLGVVAEVGEESLEALPSGAVLVHKVESTREQGRPAVLHLWYLSAPLPPDVVRLAVFSYTLSRAEAARPAAREELERLAAAIRAARFRPDLAEGEVVDV